MSLPYERYEDDIEAAEEDHSSSESEDGNQAADTKEPTRRTRPLTEKERQQILFQNRWPFGLGISLCIVGFLAVALGLIQLLLLPLVQDDHANPVKLSKRNVYGLGLWAGVLLISVGVLGMRAAIYRSVTTVYIFFTHILTNILIFFGFGILVLVGFSSEWTVPDAYPNGPAELWVYIFTVAVLVFGFILLVLGYTQFYEDVFCGELQMCRKFLHCCCPCWCPKVVTLEELLAAGRERPPSLPV